MKLVHVIGTLLVMAGIQMSASDLGWDERSQSPTLSDCDSQEPGMEASSFSSLGVELDSLQKEQSHASVTFDETLRSLNDFVDGYDQGVFNMKDLLPLPTKSDYERRDKQIKEWVKFLDENQGKIEDYAGLKATLGNCQRELEELGKFKFYEFAATPLPQVSSPSERDFSLESFGSLGVYSRTDASDQEDSDNDADPTIDSSDDEMTTDEFVKGLKKACDEIASSNMKEDINSKDSYKTGLRFTKKSLVFLEQRKKELLSDEYEGLKDRLETFKKQIEDIGEQHGWKKKTAATPQSQLSSQPERDREKERYVTGAQVRLEQDRKMARLAKLVVGGTIATLAVVAAVIWYYYKKPAAVR